MRLFGLLIFLPFFSFAQRIENTRAEAAGEQIIVTYDLTQGEGQDTYTVTLFSSFNNFRSPLTKVSGDVGPGVREGKGKRIIWEAKAEMGNYKGALSFEVEAVLVAPLALKSEVATVKRGRAVSLRWRGGDHNQNVTIELLKGGALQRVVGNVSNKGFYEWTVPSKQKPGSDYSLRLTNGRETVISSSFAIKPKIPMWVKIAVPVVIAGALLMSGNNSEPTKSDRLPAPPNILD